MKNKTTLPDPTAAAVALWLKTIDQGHIHNQGWVEINKRFHGITRGIRPLLHEQYTDPKEQEAAFDGFTLALMAIGHFEDIRALNTLFQTIDTDEKQGAKTKSDQNIA